METTAHYTRVGLFVILFTFALFIGVLWLSVGLTHKTYENYVVYMHESVSGLSVKAPVKYNGVEIGYVEKIRLYHEDPQNVCILLAIEKGTPIYRGTRAILETQGLTGIAYLELNGGVVSRGLLVAKKGKTYPEIDSAPSLLFRLDSALDNLTVNIREISTSLKDFLNTENAKAVQNTLQNFSTISDNLERNSVKLDDILTNANTTLKNTAQASQDLPAMMNSISQTTKSLQKLSYQLTGSANKVDILLSNGSTTINTFNNQMMPQLATSLTDIQAILANMKSVSAQMAVDPAVIIRGKQPAPTGPGE